MTTFEKVQVVIAGAVVATVYMMPTLVAVARLRPDTTRIVLINACLGWTAIGWFCALLLAGRPPKSCDAGSEWASWRGGRPEAAGVVPGSPETYVDGSYLISGNGRARTWAICSEGRWGIAFELDGVQRTAGWVDSSDVPIEVLAQALAPQREPNR